MNKNKTKAIFYWTATLTWMVLIFWSSSIGDFSRLTGDSGQGPSDLVSNTAHLFIFAILTGLLIAALTASGLKPARAAGWGFILAIGYGAIDEFHQYFVPGREVHLSDWLLDVAGALVVVSYYKYKYGKK